jgi:hypothetical protein
VQAAGDEHQRVGRRPVDPLEIVDDAQQRPLLRRLGEQGERAGRGQEAVSSAVRREAERRLEGAPLRR